jgi:phosphoserine phosphatase
MHEEYVLTLIAPSGRLLNPEPVVSLLHGAYRKTDPIWLNAAKRWQDESTACDIHLETQPDSRTLAEIKKYCDTARIDFVLQPTAHRQKKLLISDMDSTMIEQECIDEMADALGIKDKVAPITARAMRGELAFEPALRERVALLKDLPEAKLREVYDQRITMMPGARTLLATMKDRGVKTCLVSGGFTFFTNLVGNELGFDEHHDANTLEINDGRLTGTVADPILGKEAKLDRLKYYANQLNVPLDDTLAVGDGANDLPMLTAAGLGIAHHAKPDVQAALPNSSIRHNDLTALLYAQGISRDKWVWREPEKANGKSGHAI